MAAPLILTAQLDEGSQQFFNRQRAQYFPPERNFLQAHLTLFHHLPQDEAIVEAVQQICLQQAPIVLLVTEIKSLGKGVAYKVESPELAALHKRMQRLWHAVLTPQDRQGAWLHITIQNKVTPEVALETKAALEHTFVPFEAYATGLQLWEYLDGPWRLYRRLLFAG